MMKSITFRLTLWYALAATGTALVFLLLGRIALENNYVAGLDDLNDKEFEEIRPRIAEVDPGLPADAYEREVILAIQHHTEIDASLFFFQVSRPDHSTFFTSGNLSGHTFPDSIWAADRLSVEDEELGPVRVSTYEVGGTIVHIASSLLGWQSLNNKLLGVAFVILAAVLFTSLVIGFLLSRVALNPISNIQRIAARINAENLGERIPVPGSQDEVAQLTVLLNMMFDRLQGSFEQVRRFASEASHELKTPLSLVRLRAEELLKEEHALGPEAREEVLNQLEDIERLGKVIEDLLVLSKSEAGALSLNLRVHSTARFIEDFATDARALAEDQGIRFEYQHPRDFDATFDEIWIKHVLFNLLSNALKFAPSDSLITLTSTCENDSWNLTLDDEGPGVAEAKLHRIFDRFFSESGNQPIKGAGLGLAICRSIVQQHRGIITASRRPSLTGLRVEIRLPLTTEAESIH
jgi:two-component system heavy metal sensor histidine kinase CusS